MWNFVTQVAKNSKLSEADLVDFAVSRDSTYSIIFEDGLALISNMHVVRLVKDFKQFQEDIGEVNVVKAVELPTDISLRRAINPAFNRFLDRLGV